jgi:hypothetical protein
MKKIVRLTESDLVNIVKRVVTESKKTILTESIDYSGVKMSVFNKEYGGPVVLTYKGKSMKYSVNVIVKKSILGKEIVAYKGPISVVALWKDPAKGFFAKDNTDKVFKLPSTELQKMADAAKSNNKKIDIAGTGEIKGIEGDFIATLTQTA